MSESKPVVLVTNRFDANLKAKLGLIKEAEFIYKTDLFEDQELLSNATGLIVRTGTRIDKDFLQKTPKLKYIVTATAGFDHIDLEATNTKNVRVFHTPAAQTLAAAELSLMMLLACLRRWTRAHTQLHRGDWQRQHLLGRQIEGLQLGVIGYGRVGSCFAKKARALGMKVRAYDPFLEDNPEDMEMMGFEELMRSSDVISLHVPKTKTTRHMIKAETLGWMNTEAILLNLARGDVINEADLIEHLKQNPEFTAGLDVFAKEPLVAKSPLLQLDNVVLSPHIGASTTEALANSSKMAVDKVVALLNNQDVSDELPPKCLWWGS